MSLPNGIRGVTFDVGGTLIDPWPSVGEVYASVAAKQGVDADAALLNERFLRSWKAKRGFDYSRAHWFSLVEEAFGEIAPVSGGLFDAIYDHFQLAEPWRIHEDVMPTLRELRNRNLKLGVISNWDERLRPLLRELELEPFFDVLVISTEVGAHKPDPRIFSEALHEMRLRPEQVLHIGDSQREDVEGARSAGMQALRIVRGAKPSHTGEIDDLRALYAA